MSLKLRRIDPSFLAVCCVATLVRIGVLDRQGLWADEIFSLAMATGHSLEHPADLAEPELGDFVESAEAVPPAEYRRYLEHERPAVGPGRVVRAVLLSDSSPPLYYLLLNLWTRWTGTSDRALRLFSVFWSIVSIFLIASLARRLGGRRAVLPACLLFAFAPQSVHYSTEGRMYALVWALALGTAWVTIRLHQRGARPTLILLWAGLSAAGLLTHYFFAFVWGALSLWLAVHPHRLRRRYLVLAVGLTVLAILPWYALLPRNLGMWHVTQGWLERRPRGFEPVTAQLEILWSHFTVVGEWFASPLVDRLLMVVVLLALLVAIWRAGRQAISPRWQMLWLWIVAVGMGLLAFDLFSGTYTRAVPRYALAGMPAAFLLVAIGLARLPAATRALVLAAILTLWVPGLRRIYANDSRAGSPIREVARDVGERSGPSDVVLVHSIPSGVLGIARYIDDGAVMAPWVGQLRSRRVPEDVETLTHGRRVFLVKIHDMGEPAPEEAYLREHAAVVTESQRQVSHTIEFSPQR